VIVVSLLTLVAGVLGPASGWAGKFSNTQVSHPPDSRPPADDVQSLSIEFRLPVRALADNDPVCGQECYSFSSPGVRQENYGLQDRSYKQNFSLNLGQSGPLSFRFSGSRIKMQVEF